MNEVTVLDFATCKMFTKTFNNIEEQRKFLIKCRHSNHLFVTAYTYQSEEEKLYLSR